MIAPLFGAGSMSSQQSPDRLRVRQLQDYLGCKKTKVYELMRRKKDPLPTFKIGGTRWAYLSEVVSWVDRQPKGFPQRKN